MAEKEQGLYVRAVRWSVVVGALSGMGWVGLFSADLSNWADGDEFLTRPQHALALCVLVVSSILAVIVQCTTSVIRGQRQLAALLDQPGRGYAEGFADGLARRPVTAGRRLSIVDGSDAD